MAQVEKTTVAWSLSQSFEVCVAEYEQGIVVFHSGTGETHLLNDTLRMIFEFFWNHQGDYALAETVNWLDKQDLGDIEHTALSNDLDKLVSMQLIQQIGRE